MRSKVTRHLRLRVWVSMFNNSANTVIHQTWGEFIRVDQLVEQEVRDQVDAQVQNQLEQEVDFW